MQEVKIVCFYKPRFVIVLLFALMLSGCAAEVPQGPITVYIAGDSTAATYPEARAPLTGWGQMLQPFFNEQVTVLNEAKAGTSSKTFIEQGRLRKIAAEIKENDVLIIQFGHNDQSDDKAKHTDPYTTYKQYLTQYIDEARKHGAIPVLATPVSRNNFNIDGTMKDMHGEYPKAMIELAKEKEVAFIDMTLKTRQRFESIGPEKTRQLFMNFKPGEHSELPDGLTDNTHFRAEGAREIAKLVVEGIQENKLALAHFIRE